MPSVSRRRSGWWRPRLRRVDARRSSPITPEWPRSRRAWPPVSARAPHARELRKRRRQLDPQARRAAGAPSEFGRRSRKERDARPSTSGAGKTSPLCYFRAVGEAQRLSSDEQLRLARQQYEDARDFTVAVEEGFAILDPITLEMVRPVRRFLRRRTGHGAGGTPRRRAHRLGGGGAHQAAADVRRGGAHDGRPAAPAGRLAGRLGASLGSTGTHPWSPLAGAGDHRYAATVAWRRACVTSRSVTTRSASMSTSAFTAQIGPSPCATRSSYLPEAARAVASSPFSEGRYTHLPHDTDADLHADVSALRRSRRLRELGRVRTLRPAPSLRHQVDRRAHTDLVECPHTWRSRPWSSGSATTASPSSAPPRLWRPSRTASSRASPRALDEGEKLRCTRIASSRKTCGARFATASAA